MEKIWLSHYEPGVPEFVDLKKNKTILDLFENSCKKHEHLNAFSSFGSQITFRELHTKATSFAAWLQYAGYKKGTRIALMMPNLIQYPICLFGALKAGCVIVNCNPMYTARELTHQLNDAEAEVLIVIESFAHVVEKALPNLKTIKQIIVTKLGDCLNPIKGTGINISAKYLKDLVPNWNLPNYKPFKRILYKSSKMPFTPVDIHEDDIALLQYTGGTSGLSKGAILTHKNITYNAMQAHSWIASRTHKQNQDFVLTALPLYHIFSFTASCLVFLYSGACSILVANPRDMKYLIKCFKRYRISFFMGVNTLFNAITNYYRASEGDFSHLQVVMGGGMSIQKPVAERWATLTGSQIIQAYGLTETSPGVCMNPLNSEFNGSLGLPLPNTEVEIRDLDGNLCPIGSHGEICVRGPQVMQGYLNQPLESKKTFYPDGFLRTGDMGYMDEKGFCYLVDRIKEMIVVSGFNVYPNEVEAVVSKHPNVLEAAAIGVPNGASGEVVKIFIVKKDPNIPTTHREIVQFCRSELTGYKTPKIVEFRTELPKSNVGKILRRVLKEETKKELEQRPV